MFACSAADYRFWRDSPAFFLDVLVPAKSLQRRAIFYERRKKKLRDELLKRSGPAHYMQTPDVHPSSFLLNTSVLAAAMEETVDYLVP